MGLRRLTKQQPWRPGASSCLPLVCVGGDRTLVVRAVLAGIRHRDARPHQPVKPSFHPGQAQGMELGSSTQDQGPFPKSLFKSSLGGLMWEQEQPRKQYSSTE